MVIDADPVSVPELTVDEIMDAIPENWSLEPVTEVGGSIDED